MFAKLFDSQTLGQILVMKDYDSDNEEFKITFTVEIQDVRAEFSIGVATEDARDKAFNEMTLESSENIIKEVLPDGMLI